MAIRFRCTHCQQLMGISSRKAGQMITCTGCGRATLVPDDASSLELPALGDSEKIRVKKKDVSKKTKRKKEQQITEKKEEVSETKSVNPWDEAVSDEEEFEIRKVDTEFDDMDLTPMVDVTFLLLIFFMITASFSLQKTIQIPAPDPEQEGAAQSQTMLEELLDESIQVDINEENLIFVDDEPLADINDLVSMLSDKMIADGKSELIVTAHAVSLHENVIRVIDAAKEVGMQKIRLASTSVEED